MSNKTTELEKAEATLSALQAKRDAAAARAEVIGRERESLGYAVFVDDDAAARKKLDVLNAEGATIAGNLEALDAAIAKATEKVVAAKAAAAKAADRAAALELREAVKVFVQAGEDLDKALALMVATSVAWRESLYKVHAGGSAFPSDQQVLVLGAAAVSTSLMLTPFHRDFPHLAPGERRNAADLSRTWGANIERNNIAPRLAEAVEQKEASHAA